MCRGDNTINTHVVLTCSYWLKKRYIVAGCIVVSGMCGPKRDKVTVERRRLHDEELYALYCLPNIIRVIKSRRLRWAGHVAYRALVGKPEGRRPLGRPRR
jgi:hypothetical protein